MRLATWMRLNGLGCAEFAKLIGAHRTEVWRYATRRGAPRAGRLVKIKKATGGKVGPEDFIA